MSDIRKHYVIEVMGGDRTMRSEAFDGTWAAAVSASYNLIGIDWVESRREIYEEDKYLSMGFYDDVSNTSYVVVVKEAE